ncbi:MAG: response regulator [Polyangiales bacterium]
MTTQGWVLVVDDEQTFVDTYRDFLGDEGYVVETARSRDEALQRLSKRGCAVILLDQRLNGPAGPDVGLDLIGQFASVAPDAKVILATGYASAESIARAFRSGAYDYLKKDEHFEVFLKVKVRNAMELYRERTLARLDRDALEASIRQTWADTQTEVDPQKKGRLLEQLLVLLFRSMPGFESVRSNVQNELEEVDVLVQNNARDPFWERESQYILVECKNWSKPVGVDELTLFWAKLERRYSRCQLGLFVATGGFAKTVQIERWSRRNGQTLVLLLGPEELKAFVTAPDRGAWLKGCHARAVMAGDAGKG